MHSPFPLSGRRPNEPPRTVLLLLANSVDCDSLSLWCHRFADCEVVEATTNLDSGVERCRALRPQLTVLDATMAPQAMERVIPLVRDRAVGHVLVLDARPLEARLPVILPEPGTSYFTRAAGSRALAQAFADIIERGQRVFDPALAGRIRRTERGFQLEPSGNERTVAMLSQREREVMRHLAEGRSVRQCAEALGLSESTIDNHKSRLMKKLGIHKSAELTYRAIRDGLVFVGG
jgi:two-component system, NarL family, response regulator NreC